MTVRRPDGEATRRRILTAALRLFRKQGADATTMREIASKAKVSPGLAYHYFSSKEAMVLAYYAQTHAEHERRVRRAWPDCTTLRDRIGVAFHSKLDLLARDRRLLRTIIGTMLDPADTRSAFSVETGEVRGESIALFHEALSHPDVPESQRELLGLALWTLHMGMLLYFINDNSTSQKRTRELVDGVLDLVPGLALAMAFPLAGVAVDRLRDVLQRARLMPSHPTD